MLNKVLQQLRVLQDGLVLTGENTLIYFLVDFSASMNLSLAKKDDEKEEISRMNAMMEQLSKCLNNKGWEKVSNKVDFYVGGFGFFDQFDEKELVNEQELVDEEGYLEELEKKILSQTYVDGYCQRLFGPTQMEEIVSNPKQFINQLKQGQKHMGGRTPMLAAMESSFKEIRDLAKTNRYKNILFMILSDGDPTDCKEDSEIVKIAKNMKENGIIVLSCFISSADELVSKRMYADVTNINIQQGAKLMFECASTRPIELNFISVENYLLEYGWTLDPNYKLFIHANHSEHLHQFLELQVALISQMSNENNLNCDK